MHTLKHRCYPLHPVALLLSSSIVSQSCRRKYCAHNARRYCAVPTAAGYLISLNDSQGFTLFRSGYQ